MDKIIVTGCCGFIGSHLAEALLERGDQIIGVDNMNDYYNVNQKETNLAILKKYDKFTFLKENVIDTKVITRYSPDIVVHLAAMAGVRYSMNNPTIYIRNNVEGITNLLEQVRKLEN